MLRKKIASVFLLGFFWRGGCLPSFPLAAEKAAALYKDLCASCRGIKGKGDGPPAAALNPKPKDFTDCKSMAKESDETVFKIIKGVARALEKKPRSFFSVLRDKPAEDEKISVF